MYKLALAYLSMFIFLFEGIYSQDKEYPKLIVGIVVDQMRYDYLYKYREKYSDKGFKKLLREGYSCKNTHFNYMPTYTAPGHTSIYTGTTPENHGIIANNWYDRGVKRKIYCTEDDAVSGVGTSSKSGKMSPHRMLATTVTDELKMSSNQRSKTIGIAIKDRASILPAGHFANAAYWFEGGDSGNFISSTHYLNELPAWVKQFNKTKLVDTFLNGTWETLLPIKEYTESLADDNPYEGPFKGKDKAVFPYDLKKLRKENGNYSLISPTPFGNDLVAAFAKEAIINEKLGQGHFTDFLALSFSSPDYVGHQFGPQSIELADTYLRLDLLLADFIDFLDEKIGKDSYVLFLTADHGAVDVPAYLIDLGAPAGYHDTEEMLELLNGAAEKKFGVKDLIASFYNYQIFLDNDKIETHGLSSTEIADFLANYALSFDGVTKTLTADILKKSAISEGILSLIQKGFHQKRSGDVLLIPAPAWVSYHKTGTTHGTPYNYDTRAPLLWYGKDIPQGSTHRPVYITDIAPTISAIMDIQYPNACTGEPIYELLD